MALIAHGVTIEDVTIGVAPVAVIALMLGAYSAVIALSSALIAAGTPLTDLVRCKAENVNLLVSMRAKMANENGRGGNLVLRRQYQAMCIVR